VKIAVIGAGIAGLTAAWRLERAGHDVEVLESQDHSGGRMWSTTRQGFGIDVGAHMLLSSFDRTRTLVEEMGIGDQWFELEDGGEGGVLRNHELTSFSPKGAFDVLRYRGLPLAGRVRLLLALLETGPHRNELDFFDLSVGDATLEEEDCETFARRKLGDEATDYVVDSFIRTFHFHGAAKMSAKYFEALAALLLSRGEFRLCALRGYMRALPDALASRLSVRYEVPVSAVVSEARGVGVHALGGVASYDAVVVATPADVARTLLRSPSPAQRSVLENAASSCTALCAYAVPVDRAGAFEGIWVPFRESQIVSGISNDTNKGSTDGERCSFNVWLHEEAAASLLSRSDEDILVAVAAEVERLFPRYADLLSPLFVQRWQYALPVYGVGFVARVRAFWEEGQGDGGVWLCGDYLNHPWVEGAVRCGEKVALRLDTARAQSVT